MRSLLIACSLAFAVQAAGGHLTFHAPAAWHTRPPASSMRVAEFVIPHAPDDSEDAELIVYYFGAQGGGGAQANIDRWIGQMQQPDARPPADSAKTETRTINGLAVTGVDVSGTYVAEVRPGASEHYNKPDFRLLAAVVSTPNGPYYIKLTGPSRTVAAAKPAYDAFLGSLEYKP
ncbi:MAG TPA: hypothetical protein VL262_01075 [Vicinamibacterales bacterium]|jgi:hypothetical protein|nr:hypothetical protein [Vicinamibacterales bacterium]